MVAFPHLVPVAAGLSVVLFTSPAASDAPNVEVRVVGQGAVRLRIAEGPAAPCDSSVNRPRVSGWVEAGSAFAFWSPSGCLCVEHTWGGFREQGWSTPAIVCRRFPRWLPAPRWDPVLRIVVPTDAP
jgi:hypothetical protein